MSIRITALTMILMSLLINAHAKNISDSSGVILGTITDQNGKGIDFATISLFRDKDSLIVRTTITDSVGKFVISPVNFGRYFLKITRVGAKDYFSAVFEISKEYNKIDLGKIQLFTKENVLGGVTVTAQGKRLIQTIPGGYVFNADVDLIGKNGDAIDMLQQVPGVSSDNSSNITLRGGSPTVLVNGKEIKLPGIALINYLRSIQGTNIASIEIITSPTSKYPAAGEAGIIDIKLKTDYSKRVNGMFGLGVNTQPGGVQYGALNVKSGKLSFSLDYNVNYGEGKSFSDGDLINKYVADSNYHFLQNSKGTLYNNWQFANASIGYEPDSTLTLGADFNFGRYASLSNVNLASNIYTRNDIFQERYTQDSRQRSRNMYYMYDITMLKKMKKKGEELSGYFNVSNYRNYSFLNFERAFDIPAAPPSLNQNNDANLQYNFYTSKFDYKLPLNNKNKIEAGVKDDYSNVNVAYMSDTLNHNSNEWVTDNSITNNFLFKDNTIGIYSSLSGGGQKWDYQLGFRFENYWYQFHGSTSANRYSFSKSNLFPNFYIRYKFNTTQDISLSLGQRIQRPGYGVLNPFVNNSNYNYYSTGNPYLSPAFTYRAELQYSKYWNNYSQLLMVSLGYNYITDIIGQLLLDDGRFAKPYYTYVNYQNSNRYTLSITGQNRITKWWSINSDFNARYSDYSLSSNYNTMLSEPIFVFSGKLANNFKFWKNSNFQVTGQYLSAYNNFQNRVYPVGYVSLAFQKPLNSKWTLNASCEDILYTQRNQSVTNSSAIYVMTKSRTNSRYAIVRMTYRFGKNFDKPKKVNVENNSRL